jgi:hypothetical protein
MDESKLNSAMLKRLIYLDQCLTWRGQANRSDLIEHFGISTPQAAIDFREYLERVAEPKPVYHPGRRIYLADRHHLGLRFPDAERLPAELLQNATTDGFSQLPSPNRHCPAIIVRQLYQAMQLRQKIQIEYTSMSSGLSQSRWILPTNFASDGERVHLRAWDFGRQRWSDFLPVRVSLLSSFEFASLDGDVPRDDAWEEIVEVTLRPSSHLSVEQKAAVRLEYGFTDDVFSLKIRKALDFYVDRRWGLDRAGARLERC